MKTNTPHFVCFFCTSLTIVTHYPLIIIGATGTAKAQNIDGAQKNILNLNQSVLNGLFSHNSI